MDRKLICARYGAVPLGKQGENEVTEIAFLCPDGLEGENWVLSHRRATDAQAYPVPLKARNGTLVWVVTSGDTEVVGRGEAELTCYGKNGEVLKSQTYFTSVIRSVETGGEVPDPVKPWYDDLMEKFEQGGGSGTAGEDGGYYTPKVSQSGTGTMTVAFTASGADMPAVEPVTVTLPQGTPGEDGYTPIKGVDYFDGTDGTSVTVKSVNESTADGGSNVITFSDGKTIVIKNGSKGSTGATGAKGDKGDTGATGAKGADGHTPVKGTDYWTAVDRAEIVKDVLAALPTWTGGSY